MRTIIMFVVALSLVVPAMAQSHPVRFEERIQNEFLNSVEEDREMRAELQKQLNGSEDGNALFPGNPLRARKELRDDAPEGVPGLTNVQLYQAPSSGRAIGQQTGSSSVGAVIRQQLAPAVIQELQAKRTEIRERLHVTTEAFREAVAGKREELRSVLEEKKQEIRERLQSVRDEQKQEIVERVYDRVNELNGRLTEQYVETLNRLDAMLGSVTTRADKAEVAGLDVASVRTALTEAGDALARARAAVAEQAGKSYAFTVAAEDTLRSDVGAARNHLHTDLSAVREEVKAVHEAIRKAAVTLAQLPGVDDIEVEPETEPTSTLSAEPNQ